MFHSFRFRDWSDFKSCDPSGTPAAIDQVLGIGDGAETEFQLVRSYGTLTAYSRTITKPVAGSALVALDGVAQGSGMDSQQHHRGRDLHRWRAPGSR